MEGARSRSGAELMLSADLWKVPPEHRVLLLEDEEEYLAGRLPLRLHYDVWCWLHDLALRADSIELLAEEAVELIAWGGA